MEEELIRKQIRMNRMKLIADIILIVILSLIAIYVIKEIESFKALNRDVCAYCSAKTGAICFLPPK